MKLSKTQRLIESGRFADWFYERTGQIATTPRGEKLRAKYLKGEPVRITATLRLPTMLKK